MKQAIKRIFHAGWTNFSRNSYMSFGTTGIMALVLILFSSLIALNFVSGRIVSILQEKVDITAYFKVDATSEEILNMKADLESLPEVKGVEYISRDQALEDFKRTHAGDALIQESLAELTDNPLQASLNIKATQTEFYASIASFLEANKLRVLIDKINFYENEQVINRIQGISNGLQNWGFIITAAIAVIAILVTFNTIRLTIYNQKQEIEIMRLVGGSNWHIKSPFLVEGGIYGVFAGLIALILFYPGIYFASPKVEALMPGLSLFNYFVSNALPFSLLIMGVGIMLGVVSSFIAIRRFLKV